MSKFRERLVPGWMGSSSAIPQKAHEIEGVSAQSALALKAAALQAKEAAAARRDGGVDVGAERGARRARGLDVSALGPSNPGVRDRDERDRLELKKTGHGDDRLSELQAALAKKARTYEMLQDGRMHDDEGRYEVDFLRQGVEHLRQRKYRSGSDSDGGGPGPSGRGRQAPDSAGAALGGSGRMMSADMERERERRAWEAGQDARRGDDEARRTHKEDIRDIHDDAVEGRERAAAARRAREERQEGLKESILQAQLRELLGARQAAGKKGKSKESKKSKGAKRGRDGGGRKEGEEDGSGGGGGSERGEPEHRQGEDS
ncbi:hypothetical protein FOA52_000444 [Chlamydomonas sp. UWO 241]|nr:hypothetical protein FOA52_000444 [Chlamydomonas sp. UWO 241]